MLNNKKSFLSDRRGTVAIIFSFAMVPIVAFVGSSIDYARALSEKTRLQAITDIAAQAGARIPATANANRIEAATKSFAVNAEGTLAATINPVITASNAEVNITASAFVPTAFMKIVGIDEVQISAEATARPQIENGGVACLLALNENAPEGIHMQGINQLQSPDCWAWVNASGSESINAVGASSGAAQGFCTQGEVVGPEHFNPVPYTGCSPLPDPFKDMHSAPAGAGTCTHNNTRLNNGTHTITPGTYCGGLELKPQALVNMQPGVYVIKNGSLKVWAQSELIGDDVVFYFTGSDTGIHVQGGGQMTLRGRKEGHSYEGFLFIQDQYSNPGDQGVDIQGGGGVKMEGILYTPTWQVAIGGNGEVNQNAKFWVMVADSFHMEGNGTLHIRSNASAIGLPNLMPRIKNGPVILK